MSLSIEFHIFLSIVLNALLSLSGSSSILGGENAELGQYPWMALLGQVSGDSEDVEYYCGGSVINRRFVLTAAHCVQRDIETLLVVLGENNLDEDPDCLFGICAPPAQRLRIQKVISHPDYEDAVTTSPHDITLIRTAADITFNDFVQPICLPFNQTNITNYPGEVAGWGSNSRYGRLRTIPTLQRLQVEMLPAKECKLKIQDSQLCATSGPSQDTCNGDSGGPLMIQTSLQYYLVGVLSYGHDICGYFKRPMIVYTKVSSYLGWILHNIRSLTH